MLGTIAENYFDHLTYTVRAELAPTVAKNIPGLQVTASEPEWGNFIEEAMRDKTTAAQLLTFYTTWVNLPAAR